jgi:hypothetical protein
MPNPDQIKNKINLKNSINEAKKSRQSEYVKQLYQQSATAESAATSGQGYTLMNHKNDNSSNKNKKLVPKKPTAEEIRKIRAANNSNSNSSSSS